MKYLKIVLSGETHHYSSGAFTPMTNSKYYKTERYPTRNAVVGMISAALGYKRGDDRINDLKNTLALKIEKDPELLKYRSSFSIYTDYQIMRFGADGEGYHRVSGSKTSASTNIIKDIEYLQNARFFVYVGADEETLKNIHAALRNPKMRVYLGKKNCPINRMPVPRDFSLIDEKELPHVYDCP